MIKSQSLSNNSMQRTALRPAERGLMIRPCFDFRGLDKRYCRIAVRGPQDNQELLEAMKLALQ